MASFCESPKSSKNNGKMADAVDIDLYADDVGDEFAQEESYNGNVDLYDDVITSSSGHGGAGGDTTTAEAADPPEIQQSKSSESESTTTMSDFSGKRVPLYVGNLTWWTTDQDLTDAILSIGVRDLVEVKFYENRANGQSKGFAVVSLASHASSRLIMEKLPKKELYGQNPVVTHCNRQALSQFEAQSRKTTDNPGSDRNHERDRQAGSYRSDKHGPGGMRNQGPPMGGRGRAQFPPTQRLMRPPGPPGGPHGPPGPPPGFGGPPPRGPPPRGPPPGAQGPPRGPPPPGMSIGHPGMPPRPVPPPQGPPPGPPPHMRGPPPDQRAPPPGHPGPNWDPRHPPASAPYGGPPPGNASVPPPTQVMPGMRGPPPGMPPFGMPPVSGPPPTHATIPPPQGVPPPAPHVNPAFFPPQGPPPAGTQSDYRSTQSDRTEPSMSDSEFEELMSKNKSVSSSAISRAVADASVGDFASAIETLVTAISLIKQSKVATDDRCKILIGSLQDTLHGIEEKSYGSRSKSRDRSRDRERRREKSSRRDRSRSRDREYRDRSRERDRYEDERRHRDRERDDRVRNDRDRERDYHSSTRR